MAAAYDWIDLVQGRHQEALRWLAAFLEALDSLRSFPLRCPLAPEAGPCARDIRQLLFFSHRILFVVTGHRVDLLQVRHASREPAQPEELDPDD